MDENPHQQAETEPDLPVERELTDEERRRAEAHRRKIAGLRPWRPGQSGNPDGARGRRGKTNKKREIVLEAEAAARSNGTRETSLQYLRRLMNDPEASIARRDRAAECLARIEADILLRMEERSREGGFLPEKCNTPSELVTAMASELRRSEAANGLRPPDRCGLEFEDFFELVFAFMDGDQVVCSEIANLLERTREPMKVITDIDVPNGRGHDEASARR